MRVIVLAYVGLITATPASAGFLDQMGVHQKIGYAQAAISACVTLKINPQGILKIMQSLDASDQAAVASNSIMTNHSKGESAKLFSMLGDTACDAALDYEKKLGIDIFQQR